MQALLFCSEWKSGIYSSFLILDFRQGQESQQRFAMLEQFLQQG